MQNDTKSYTLTFEFNDAQETFAECENFDARTDAYAIKFALRSIAAWEPEQPTRTLFCLTRPADAADAHLMHNEDGDVVLLKFVAQS